MNAAAPHADVVIVGGGAGGVELAARLGRHVGREGPRRVLLIDRAALHIWKPTLHEVAVGTLDPQQEGLSYAVLARRNHFGFTVGELSGLDAATRTLTLAARRDEGGKLLVPERRMHFGHLVLAVGSGSNFFGTPGAADHAQVLEHAGDAEQFRQHLLDAYTRSAYANPPTPLRVVIVGGGATGVELAAELRESHAEALLALGPARAFALDTTLVEAGPRLLGGLPARVAEKARAALVSQGVRVLTATKVQAMAAHEVTTSVGPLAADLIVWAAGIKADAGNAVLGLTINRLNQFVVDAQLQTSAPGVWAIGDCAACIWHGEALVPARAQAASQQASYLAKLLQARLRGKAFDAPFAYRDRGSLVSLGDNRGVGNLMGSLGGTRFFVEGLIAKWMYISLHLMHHRAILGLGGTALLALARLAQRRVSGRVKLH